MDNAQKAIIIGVGLFITIIVIAAVMLITGMGQDLLNSGTNQLSNTTNAISNKRNLYSGYDNKSLSGRRTLTAINQLLNDVNIKVIGIQNIRSNSLYSSNEVASYMFWVTEKCCGYWNTTWKLIYNDGTKGGFTGGNITKCIGMDCTRLADTTPVNVSECSNSSSKYYINPTATYKSVLIENNGDIIGVYFFLLR